MQLKSLSMLNLVCLLLITVQAIGFFVALNLLNYQKELSHLEQKNIQSSEPAIPTLEEAGEQGNEKQIKYVTEDYIQTQPELAKIFESKLITQVWPKSIVDEKGVEVAAWLVEAVVDKNTINTGAFIAHNSFDTYLIWQDGWVPLAENERCMVQEIRTLGQGKSVYTDEIPNIIIKRDECYSYRPGTDGLIGIPRVSLFNVDTKKKIPITDPSALINEKSVFEMYLFDQEDIPSKLIENGNAYGELLTVDPNNHKIFMNNSLFQPKNYTFIMEIDFITGKVVDSLSTN